MLRASGASQNGTSPMSAARLNRSTPGRRALAALAAAATAAAMSAMWAQEAAADPLPTATQVKEVKVTGVPIPANAPGNPGVIVAAKTEFQVTVMFSDSAGNPLPPSWNKATTVTFSVEDPP